MNKMISAPIALTLVLALLSGCSGQPATTQPPSGEQNSPTQNLTPAPDANSDQSVKTGFSMVTSVSGSKDAATDSDGNAQADITLVAVTVTEDGVIESCVIDGIQSKIGFTSAGQLTTDPATTFPSKNELGDTYGMKSASSIGREWNEQAADLADYAVGKTVAQLKGLAVNEKGAPSDTDLAASVTISIGNFISGIEHAVNNAKHLGAKHGDRLVLSSSTTMSDSKDASKEEDGLAQAYTTAAALTFDGETITSCYLDAVQSNVYFNAEGTITSDFSAVQLTKNQLGDDYGMKAASSIGKEWYE